MSRTTNQSDNSFFKYWQLIPLFVFPVLDLIPYMIAGELAFAGDLVLAK